MVTKVTSKVLGSDVSDVNLADSSVGSSELKANAVITDKLMAQAVTTVKIADLNVTTAKIADRNVTSVKIALAGVITENINDSAVVTAKLADNAVTTDKILALAVTTAKLADTAVTTAKIGDDQVTRAKIAPNAVGQDEIQNNTVSLDKIVKGNQGSIPICGANGDLAFLAVGTENAVMAIQNGVPVWSTQVFFPGMMMDYAGATSPTGWLFANGMTIGNGSSGANGRSNADCQSLFIQLWNAFPNDVLAVSGGRGSNAAADWAANKTIQLPDARGRVVVGRDTMGFTAAARLTEIDTPDQVGISGGVDSQTLTAAHVPPHRHWMWSSDEHYGGGYPVVDPYNYPMRSGGNDNYKYTIRSQGNTGRDPTNGLSSNPVINGTVVSPTPTAIDNMPPFIIMSKIIKL